MKKVLLLVVFVLALSIGVNPITSSAEIADGTHNLTYQVNKPDSSSASMANDYFLKPAKLIVTNGKMKVQMTIKNSSWVKEFKPPGGAAVISTNAKADQRVVQFNVANLNTLKVAMKIDIDEIDYHHSYTVDFVFKSDGLPEKKVTENPSSSNTGGKGSSSNAGASENTSKPSETKKPNSSAQSSEKQSVQNQQGNQTSQGTSTDSSNENESSKNDENLEVDDSKEQSTDSVESNPETSDEFPYYALILALASIVIIVCNKKLYIRKP